MDEKKFFEKGNVLVTGSRFVVNSQTYAMSNVTSVKTGVKPASNGFGVILVILGFCLIFLSDFNSNAIISGIISLIIGVLVIRSAKATYSVVLNTSAGENQALVSNDKEYIESVISSLNEAIISRG